LQHEVENPEGSDYSGDGISDLGYDVDDEIVVMPSTSTRSTKANYDFNIFILFFASCKDMDLKSYQKKLINFKTI
jgi:hypothetical protein